MLNVIKRWISGGVPGPDWSSVSAWAQKHGHGFKRARDDEGFVIDGHLQGKPWRLEWGPPQRAYIAGHELRLRMELGLSSGLQMLLMSRPLLESLERETFERYTQSNQTLIDVSTPEEMRWLAMFPKVNLEIPKDLRAHFAAVASDPPAAASWVDAPMAQQLEKAAAGLLAQQPAFVLMTLRGRLYMRMQFDAPEPERIGEAVELFQEAAHGALRVGSGVAEPQPDFPSTASTAWQTDILPDDPKDGSSR
jgi:hypothetical protein